ncbi:hypothetical protein MNV49_004918 [Pseudohyphozyma bogoriensis]|nr:hypothetical protein MNV49_004918 [Pseudohyphozyma bogoriensis]
MVGTHLLPPNLLKLFAPRPPLPYLKPTGRDPDFPLKSRARKPPSLGVADTLALIRDEREANEAKAAEEGAEGEQEDGEEKKEDGEGMYTLCGEEAFKLRVEQRQKDHKERLEQGTKNYNPADDEEVMGDPYKTLFVGRLPYALDEHDLRREFEMYGPLDRIRLVRDKDGKSRGYAFLIYEREKDMKAAYKDAEGLKLMNRRLLIDVERGRTVKGWKPRRLGGGLGGRPKPIAQGPGRGYGGPPGGGYQGQNGPDSGYGKRPNDFGGGGFEDAKRPRY